MILIEEGGFNCRCCTTALTAAPSLILEAPHCPSDSIGGYPVTRIRSSSHGWRALTPTRVMAGGSCPPADDSWGKWTLRMRAWPPLVWKTVSYVVSSLETPLVDGLRITSSRYDWRWSERLILDPSLLPVPDLPPGYAVVLCLDQENMVRRGVGGGQAMEGGRQECLRAIIIVVIRARGKRPKQPS